MRVFGREQTFGAVLTEPESGRVLVETDLGSRGAITTFTVNPGEGHGTSGVTISTQLPVRTGILRAISAVSDDSVSAADLFGVNGGGGGVCGT